MGGLQRSLVRAQRRRNGINQPVRPRVFQMEADGGYSVLRPTKGWFRVSAARLRAQGRLARLLDRR